MWDLFYFVVNDFIQTQQNLEEGEEIQIELIERGKIMEMCLNGLIGEERSALVLLRFLNKWPVK